MAAITIRWATAADIPLIRQFIADLALYERAPDQAKATDASLSAALFPPDGSRPYVECLIGELDGAPQGFALFFHNFSSWVGKPGIYLEDLFVRPEARGAGLGKRLLQRLAQIAQERGCQRIDWVVLDWNTPAIDFYKAIGARGMDDWTGYRLEGEAIGRFARS